jgi:hypothetical protein
MEKIGSQIRQEIEESEYDIVQIYRRTAILRNRDTGKDEVWAKNNNFAGYVIVIDGQGYEFMREQ